MNEYNHVDAAIEDLSRFYDELNDGDLHRQIKERVTIPEGEHAEVYKQVRAEVERFLDNRRLLGAMSFGRHTCTRTEINVHTAHKCE